MIDPTEPLQEAIVAAVRALTPRITIYDEPPAAASYPYISLSGIVVEDDGDGECYAGSIATATLHLCDRDQTGTKQARAMGQRLTPVLDAPLNVAGFDVIVHQVASAVYAADPESPVRGTLQFRYDLTPKA